MVGASKEQNEQNKVQYRDARRKERLVESTSCYVRAYLGRKRSPVQIRAPRPICLSLDVARVVARPDWVGKVGSSNLPAPTLGHLPLIA